MFGGLDLRVVAMLAEIFMVRLEAAARLMEGAIPSRASRFTPFTVGVRFTAQAQQPPQPIAPLPKLNNRSDRIRPYAYLRRIDNQG